jgi:hypothetical protein
VLNMTGAFNREIALMKHSSLHEVAQHFSVGTSTTINRATREASESAEIRIVQVLDYVAQNGQIECPSRENAKSRPGLRPHRSDPAKDAFVPSTLLKTDAF